MYKFFQIIKGCTADWSATDIFFRESYPYNGRDWSIPSREYTKLGQFFEDMPAIFSLVKLLYYIFAFPLEFVLFLFWNLVIYPFMPKSWRL